MDMKKPKITEVEWISLEDKKPKDMTSLWVTDGWSCAEAYCWENGKIVSAYDTFDTLENMKEITLFIELPNPPNLF